MHSIELDSGAWRGCQHWIAPGYQRLCEADAIKCLRTSSWGGVSSAGPLVRGCPAQRYGRDMKPHPGKTRPNAFDVTKMSEREIAAEMARHMAKFGDARQAASKAAIARPGRGLSFLQPGMRTAREMPPTPAPPRNGPTLGPPRIEPTHRLSEWAEREPGRSSSLSSYRAGLLTGVALVLIVAGGSFAAFWQLKSSAFFLIQEPTAAQTASIVGPETATAVVSARAAIPAPAPPSAPATIPIL